MKFNFENFMQSNKTSAEGIYYIKDGENLVKYTKINDLTGVGFQYHTVDMWACFELNGELYFLIYLENPRVKCTIEDWLNRRKYFLEILETLKGGN